jgi:regulator of replication initiation timing
VNIGEFLQNILAKVSGTDGKIDALSKQLDELKLTNGSAVVELEAKTAEVVELKAQLAEAPKLEEFKAATDKVAELQAIVDGEPQRINAALSAEISKFGAPPITPAQQGNAPVKTQAEFNAMSFVARNEFIRGGGKISKETQP